MSPVDPATDEAHAKFMARAIELARSGSAAGHGGPFGCVVVKDGKIVGEGFNQCSRQKIQRHTGR